MFCLVYRRERQKSKTYTRNAVNAEPWPAGRSVDQSLSSQMRGVVVHGWFVSPRPSHNTPNAEHEWHVLNAGWMWNERDGRPHSLNHSARLSSSLCTRLSSPSVAFSFPSEEEIAGSSSSISPYLGPILTLRMGVSQTKHWHYMNYNFQVNQEKKALECISNPHHWSLERFSSKILPLTHCMGLFTILTPHSVQSSDAVRISLRSLITLEQCSTPTKRRRLWERQERDRDVFRVGKNETFPYRIQLVVSY